jgi:hypothetical protein
MLIGRSRSAVLIVFGTRLMPVVVFFTEERHPGKAFVLITVPLYMVYQRRVDNVKAPLLEKGELKRN